jgi:hypothetical protein
MAYPTLKATAPTSSRIAKTTLSPAGGLELFEFSE